MKPAPFAYHRAHSVAEAVALLAELGDEAKILAGGLSLVPMMNFRLARPTALVDVSRIDGLSYLRASLAGPTPPTRPTPPGCASARSPPTARSRSAATRRC